MPQNHQKTAEIGKKLQLQKKFKNIVEETETVRNLLENCTSKFHQRLKELNDNRDEFFLNLYEDLNADFDKYLDNICYIHASFQSLTGEDEETIPQQEILHEKIICDNNICTPQKEGSCSSILHNDTIPKTLWETNAVSLNATIFKSSEEVRSYYCDTEENTQNVCQKSYSIRNTTDSQSSLNYVSLDNTDENNVPDYLLSSFPDSSSSYYSFPPYLQEEVRTLHSHSSFHSLEDTDSQLNENLSISPPDILFPCNLSGNMAHVVDPSDFWMKLTNSDIQSTAFAKSHFVKYNPPTVIEVGSYYLAPISNSNSFYYRVKALSSSSNAEQIKVFYIDFGSTQICHINDLRFLPSQAYKVPMQAINCFLLDVSPLHGIWSHEAIKKFNKFRNNSIQIYIAKKVQTKYGVQLNATVSVDMKDCNSCDIARVLYYDSLCCLNESEENEECDLNRICNQDSSDSGVSFSCSQQSTSNVHCDSNYDELISLKDKVSGFSEEVQKPIPNDNLIGEYFTSPVNQESKTELVDNTQFSNWHFLNLIVPPPNLSFITDNLMIVVLSYIINPKEFYINIAMEDSSKLDELRDQMTSFYRSQEQNIPISYSDLHEGVFCAGLFLEDGFWYRIKVLKFPMQSESENLIYIQYIDYGNKAWINVDNLLPLMPDFVIYPAFAVECSLAGISPKYPISTDEASDSKCNVWSYEAVEKFKDLAGGEKCLTAQICDAYLNKEVQHVMLWDTTDKDDFLINAALVTKGFATYDDCVSDLLFKQKMEQLRKDDPTYADLEHWDPMSEEYHHVENSYGVHTDNFLSAFSGYQQQDEKYVCRNYSLRGYCLRRNCPYEHVYSVESGVTRDRVAEYACETELPLPAVCSFILLQVSAVINPRLFYATLPYGCLNVDEVDSAIRSGVPNTKFINHEATELFKELNKHYSSAPFSENTAIALACGNIVVGWRSYDQSWHRGRITEVVDTALPAKVFFVDFGDQEWVPRKQIRSILPEYLFAPFQAIECHLSEIVPLGFEKNKTWSTEAKHRFMELVSGEVLLGKVISKYGRSLDITLQKTTNGNALNIGEQLISEGYAQTSSLIQSDKEATKYVPG